MLCVYLTALLCTAESKVPSNAYKIVPSVLLCSCAKEKKEFVECDHQIGYWQKSNKGKKLVSLANFEICLLKRVIPPPNLPRETGFLVEVTQKRPSSPDVMKGCMCYAVKVHENFFL